MSGTFPNEWKSNIIVPIPKCTTPTSVDRFRGISLISECFCEVIRQRLTGWADRNQKIPPAQFGFWKGHSTVDNLFVLSALTQRAKKLKKPLYSILVDFRKAFDSIKHNLLWTKLQEMATQITTLLQNMYSGINSAVRIPSSMTSPISSPITREFDRVVSLALYCSIYS